MIWLLRKLSQILVYKNFNGKFKGKLFCKNLKNGELESKILLF